MGSIPTLSTKGFNRNVEAFFCFGGTTYCYFEYTLCLGAKFELNKPLISVQTLP
ncbi:hypothetical protein [Psychroserpens sp.]|uniref:hypothetical protein n=1 Tax=Psychroserpens sp. TaxID=2020870 RepID=UPI003C75C3E1